MPVDCHTHLEGFGDRLPDALLRMERHNIHTMAVAVDIPSYELACALAKRHPLITPTFGIHPNRAGEYEHRLEELDGYLSRGSVIGEIGLCSVWADNLPAQRVVFDYQLRYAHRHGKAVNLHTKGQEREIADALRRFAPRAALIHWYSGPLEVLDELIALDCYFSVSVDLPTGELSRQICRRVPIDRLLTETDGPGALEWVCGRQGQPETVLEVAHEAARLRGIPAREFERIMLRNYTRFCGEK